MNSNIEKDYGLRYIKAKGNKIFDYVLRVGICSPKNRETKRRKKLSQRGTNWSRELY